MKIINLILLSLILSNFYRPFHLLGQDKRMDGLYISSNIKTNDVIQIKIDPEKNNDPLKNKNYGVEFNFMAPHANLCTESGIFKPPMQ